MIRLGRPHGNILSLRFYLPLNSFLLPNKVRKSNEKGKGVKRGRIKIDQKKNQLFSQLFFCALRERGGMVPI